MNTRQGKHKEGKTSIGLYVDDDFRALLAFLVDQTGDTATNIIMDGVRSRATALGIMVNDEINPRFRYAIEIIKEGFVATRKAKANTKKGSAK